MLPSVRAQKSVRSVDVHTDVPQIVVQPWLTRHPRMHDSDPRAQQQATLQSLLQQQRNPYSGQAWAEHCQALVIDAHDGRLSAAIQLQLGYPGAAQARLQLGEQLQQAGFALPLSVSVAQKIRSHRVQGELKPHAQIRNIIAVGSGKGGVGKSTVSVNLALALAALGARVGLLDADIYGPSQPTMLALRGRPEITADKKMVPHQAHGLQVNSIGFLVDTDEPMIWRGPMVSQALQQLLNETRWEQLDYLIIDLPPGTGDIQLTLLQKVPVAAAVVVTTPQEVATLDAGKAVQMFAKLQVPTLGLVENMSQHVCSACGHVESIFGSAGGQRLADRYDLPLLAQLPLDSCYREHVDAGLPTVAAAPQSSQAQVFMELALQVSARLAQQPLSKSVPELKVKLSG